MQHTGGLPEQVEESGDYADSSLVVQVDVTLAVEPIAQVHLVQLVEVLPEQHVPALGQHVLAEFAAWSGEAVGRTYEIGFLIDVC